MISPREYSMLTLKIMYSAVLWWNTLKMFIPSDQMYSIWSIFSYWVSVWMDPFISLDFSLKFDINRVLNCFTIIVVLAISLFTSFKICYICLSISMLMHIYLQVLYLIFELIPLLISSYSAILISFSSGIFNRISLNQTVLNSEVAV